MNSYITKFTGRLRGAIGMRYKISSPIVSEKPLTKEEILIDLYKEYDHISDFSYIELTGKDKQIMECEIPVEYGDHVDVDRDIERKHGL